MTASKTASPTYPHAASAGVEIDQAFKQAIAQASLSNERKIAYARFGMLAIASVLDVLVFFFPQTLINVDSVSPTIAIFSLIVCSISAGFLIVLRRPNAWRNLLTLQVIIPIFDGILVAIFTTNIWQTLAPTKPEIITNIAAFCCFLAVSGGIRVKSRSSIISTSLALGNFVYAAVLFQLDVAVSLFALFTILGTGFLGMLTASIVRRQGKNEAGRLLMRQFLPESVVETAFESPTRLLEEAQECEVTILVTDLRGFTHYSESMSPLEVLDFLNTIQSFLAETVEQHGGWVDKFMGDGMLAVFGAPAQLNNHAEQAFQAAQEILLKGKTKCPLPIGVGLHSGPIVAGCLGATGRLEFTVIGDTVNVASRLESLTKDWSTSMLMSRATAHQLRSPQNLKPLGSVPIRGREQGIEIFTLPEVSKPGKSLRTGAV
ncbi:MAG: adenylate/guanylate cyclase domain-containing protein [Leptolyngbya sp. SIOISBB]|nr:adenylate/guanylate cyclase domain-containing protein [Leptolyngbya sp. SIOISBB]